MIEVSASEANRQFSKLLREVAEGETVVITSHGKPVAKVVSISGSEGDFRSEFRRAARQRLWERLHSQPALNLKKMTRDEIYEEAL